MVNVHCSDNSSEKGSLLGQKCDGDVSMDEIACAEQTEDGRKVYRLTIQIDKIKERPCPKSKKIGYLADKPREEQEKLVSEEAENAGKSSRKQCTVCNIVFQSAQSLFLHKKKNHRLNCQICDIYCSSKVIHEKHEKLHMNDDHELPYKCHLCPEKFVSLRNVRLHMRIVHAFAQSNTGKTWIPWKDNFPLPYSVKAQIHEETEKNAATVRCTEPGISANYDAVTFTCRFCSEEFSTVEDAETHTRQHTKDVQEEYKCNTCQKVFKSESFFNSHLAQHLSRAFRCPICPKAFVSRATLRIHMNGHVSSNR